MKKIILLVLACQLGVQPSLYGFSDYVPPQENVPIAALSRKTLLKDPLFEEFERANQIPLELGLSGDDPSLDQDPFFLGAQKWSEETSNPESSALSYNERESSVSITLPGLKTVWNLDAALKPILATDEFILFAAKENFSEFARASSGLEVAGEGIFFISYSDLLSASTRRLRVPVFFLPLPESGWRGDITAVNFVQDGIIGLANSDRQVILPFRTSDIREVMKAERSNLLLATTMTLSRMGKAALNVTDLREVRPDPGITAGFGVLFTGINSKNLGNSLFALNNESFSKTLLSKASGLIVQFFQIPRAQATPVSPDLTVRLVRVAEVVSLALIASVVLKYWLYHSHFKKKNAAEGKLGIAQLIRRETRDVGDVFAHSLATFSQFAGVWYANSLEFLGDRYFPQLSSGHNTLIRKFMDKTVYFVRGSNDHVSVSGKTWLFGAVILGGIDTFFLAVQLYYVVPWLGQGLAEHFPELKSRVETAFAIGNPNTASLVQNEVLGCGAGYCTGGASGFSGRLQSQFLEKVTLDVKDRMRREGLDPDASRNSAELARRVDERLDSEMQKIGLPSKENFLFDANALYTSMIELLGYSVPQKVLTKGFNAEKFLGVKRPGLIISTTKLAIERLENRVKQNPLGSNGSQASEALELLRKSSRDMNILWNFVRAPVDALFPQNQNGEDLGTRFKSYLNRFRSARTSMMVLTYEGDAGDIIDFIPDSWRGASSRSIELASKYFREALDDNLQGGKPELAAYLPEAKDSVAQWQEQRAITQASEHFLKQHGKTFDAYESSDEEIQIYKRLYTEALNKILGLYPDYSGHPDLESKILERSTQYTSAQLSELQIQKFLSSLDKVYRVNFEASLQAANFVKAYLEMVVVAGDVAATSPAQPGRLQWLRQKSLVRKNMVLTRLVRMGESVVAGESLQIGRRAQLERNIPGWNDFKKSNKRAYAAALTKMTAIYAFDYFIWGINLNAAMWTLSLVAKFTIGAPAHMLNRLFAYQGWKPMGKMATMSLFAFIYTWATFWGQIPVQIFATDFEKSFRYIFSDHLALTLGASASLMALLNYREKAKDIISDTADKLSHRTMESSLHSCGGLFRSL